MNKEDLKNVWSQVEYQVSDQVMIRIKYRAWDQVRSQIRNQLWSWDQSDE